MSLPSLAASWTAGGLIWLAALAGLALLSAPAPVDPSVWQITVEPRPIVPDLVSPTDRASPATLETAQLALPTS